MGKKILIVMCPVLIMLIIWLVVVMLAVKLFGPLYNSNDDMDSNVLILIVVIPLLALLIMLREWATYQSEDAINYVVWKLLALMIAGGLVLAILTLNHLMSLFMLQRHGALVMLFTALIILSGYWQAGRLSRWSKSR